jgi:hypothetical protein
VTEALGAEVLEMSNCRKDVNSQSSILAPRQLVRFAQAVVVAAQVVVIDERGQTLFELTWLSLPMAVHPIRF